MPQYVSLADQGFYIPYEMLGRAAANYRDRKERQQNRKEDVNWRNTLRGDDLARDKFAQERQGKFDAVELPAKQLNLQELQEQTKQRKALEGLDLSSFRMPGQYPADGAQGPPTPEMRIDLAKPWTAQAPGVAQAASAQTGIPPALLQQAFLQQQSALGMTPMPQGPAGMRPTKATIGGVTYEGGQLPPEVTVVDTPEGKLYFDKNTGQQLSAPRTADGLKELTQGETKKLEAIQQARVDLNTIEENLKKNFSSLTTGPILGRLQKLNPWAEDARVTDQAVKGATPNLARGVFGEVGVLTDADRKVYESLIPTYLDNPAQAQRKLDALRSKLESQEKLSLSTLASAGRDVSGFKAQAPTTPKPTFQSVQEAEAAGLPPGTVVEIFDPATGKYRPARIE
jgi:hypothetical protein